MNKPTVIVDPHNLSSLYFTDNATVEPYVGPMQIASDVVVQGRGLVASRDIKVGECLFVTPPTVSVPVTRAKELYLQCRQELESIAEGLIVDEMQSQLQSENAASFLALVGANTE